jgi:hypothetical protein
VSSFHANALRELTDFAVTQQQLLLKIGTLEVFACLAQAQSK